MSPLFGLTCCLCFGTKVFVPLHSLVFVMVCLPELLVLRGVPVLIAGVVLSLEAHGLLLLLLIADVFIVLMCAAVLMRMSRIQRC